MSNIIPNIHFHIERENIQFSSIKDNKIIKLKAKALTKTILNGWIFSVDGKKGTNLLIKRKTAPLTSLAVKTLITTCNNIRIKNILNGTITGNPGPTGQTGVQGATGPSGGGPPLITFEWL